MSIIVNKRIHLFRHTFIQKFVNHRGIEIENKKPFLTSLPAEQHPTTLLEMDRLKDTVLSNGNPYLVPLTFHARIMINLSLPQLSIHQNACLDEYNNSRPKNVFQFFSTFFHFFSCICYG